MEAFLSAGITVTIFLLGILLYEIREIRKKQADFVTNGTCTERRSGCKPPNDEEHKEIWERVNHHRHNGEGRVIVS